MDLYLPSSEAGLSLQEMIDFDIKMASDIEGADPIIPSSELNFVDLSGMSSLENDLDLKGFEPLFDPLTLEKLDDMDVVDPAVDELNTINSWMNMSSMNNYSLDFENSVMVNPSAVLPSTLPSRQVKTEAPAATVTTTTTTTTNCNTSQTPNTRILPTLASTAVSGTLNSVVKSEPLWSTSSVQTPQTQVANGTTVTTHVTVVRPQVTSGAAGLRTNQQSPLVTTKTHQISSNSGSNSSTPGNGGRGKLTSQNSLTHTPKLNGHVTNSLNNSTGSMNSKSPHTLINNRVKSMGKPPRKDLKQEEKVLPKPAYSYSCLIALALKNSVTGSLPVSEIYSFMCEHFPYFKTAPNGWKNSVRHNLSLNKCFEKIEKPVVAGSNQRKGCLWALNPAKAHKMDEEVQKWSKKDIQGIKDAMAYPEVLDALERGEMKFESTGSLSSCSEDEDEEEEVDPLTMDTLQSTPTVGTIKILNPLTKPTIQQPTQKVLTGSSSHRTNTTHSSKHHSTPVSGRTTTTTASIIRTPSNVVARTPTTVSSSDDPEFILPDSTMTEISLQSDGALLDDLGNEISIMDSESPATGSRTGLVVRKLPSVSPIRSTVRANYVYAPSISSPHHQNLNRLVLTNAKMS